MFVLEEAVSYYDPNNPAREHDPQALDAIVVPVLTHMQGDEAVIQAKKLAIDYVTKHFPSTNVTGLGIDQVHGPFLWSGTLPKIGNDAGAGEIGKAASQIMNAQDYIRMVMQYNQNNNNIPGGSNKYVILIRVRRM